MKNENQCWVSKDCKGITCPITGFKFFLNKKFVIGALVMAVWMNLFSWFWHGNIMSSMYQQTAALWRAPQDMDAGLLTLGISIMAILASYIFMKGYEGQGWREGLRFGIIVTIFLLGLGLITNSTQPIPAQIIKFWTLGDLISYSLGGVILSCVYCKTKDNCCAEKS